MNHLIVAALTCILTNSFAFAETPRQGALLQKCAQDLNLDLSVKVGAFDHLKPEDQKKLLNCAAALNRKIAAECKSKDTFKECFAKRVAIKR